MCPASSSFANTSWTNATLRSELVCEKQSNRMPNASKSSLSLLFHPATYSCGVTPSFSDCIRMGVPKSSDAQT